MMSNIKVGDKVRFLNSTGGGVVRSFKGKDQVLVEDEDGFEVPVLIRECVVVGDSEMQVHSSRRSPLPSVTQAAVLQPKKPEPLFTRHSDIRSSSLKPQKSCSEMRHS